MKCKQKNREVVVFSGWSRKAYAIFASLKKVVRIASLSIDVCIMSLLKNPSVVQLMDIFNAENDDTEELEAELEGDLSQLAILPVVANNDTFSSLENIKIQPESPYFVSCKIWAFVLSHLLNQKSCAEKVKQKAYE